MSETDPKEKIDPEVKPDTEKEEPGEKELSEEDLDKVAGGRRDPTTGVVYADAFGGSL